MSKAEIDLFSELEIKVQFYDLDPMSVVWHGNYFRYFEEARCALLDRIQYNYLEMRDSGYAWPIVDARIKFIRPLVFGQRVRVRATLEEYETRLKIGYEIRNGEGVILTRGSTIQVAVDMATEELCFTSPPILIERVTGCS